VRLDELNDRNLLFQKMLIGVSARQGLKGNCRREKSDESNHSSFFSGSASGSSFFGVTL
jgi:hypothetical protein